MDANRKVTYSQSRKKAAAREKNKKEAFQDSILSTWDKPPLLFTEERSALVWF